ncbi:MAG: hypothetical protein R3E01_12365 [Pirellulaceae bacterium]|nr:PQQ-dependent sugar dehydrogenase [Planctomycetales bacterium]
MTFETFDTHSRWPWMVTLWLSFSLVLTAGTGRAQVPFGIQGPGVDPTNFRITRFADGLNFPVGMTQLADGSVLVAVCNGNGGFYSSTSGSLIRLADNDGDGVADERTTLVANVPGGKLSALRSAGDLVFVTGQGGNVPITIYRMGETPSSPMNLVGRVNLNYPGSWLHPHSALAVRESPDVPGSYDVFFQLGSRTNFDDTSATVSLGSTIGSTTYTINGDAIHMLRIKDEPAGTLSLESVTEIATGLRNAAGMAFHPATGDLYLQDNGIDGVVVAIEPTSADELNVIPAANIGGDIEDFGFPFTYEQYRTGTKIGNTGIDPLVAFQPIPQPNGSESEGPNDIVFAPAEFPEALRNGMFVGFHGQFSSGGLNNEENPLVFVDLNDNSYFHFIENTESGVGHLDGLLATNDSLFVADISPAGAIGASNRNSGVIYQLQAIGPTAADPDFNGDGFVDGADFLIWQSNFGTTTGASVMSGDADSDGDVDDDDFDYWRTALNAGNVVGNNHSVPEPNVLLVALPPLGIWLRRRYGRTLSSIQG